MNGEQPIQSLVTELLHWVELVALGVELLAIGMIVLAIVYASGRYLYESLPSVQAPRQYDH